MKTVAIAHITDLHFSESLLKPNESTRLPHRYGHDLDALYQLDSRLKSTKWDILVVSGDVSRVGHRDSFLLARLWLAREIDVGKDLSIGLNLKSKGIPYVIVPGNHDRFDDNLTQDVLDGYYETFPYIKPNETVTHNVNGITVKFHLYDSSHRGGGFATGKIDDIDMVTKSCSPGALDVAILHHHLFPPPGYSDRFGDLENADDALAYFVACGFDAILVGHTHVSYFETFSIRSLGAVVTDSRRVGRIAKKIAQWSSWLEGERWFKVPTCADGKRPALSEYVEYLYIRNTLGRTMPEVKSFSSVRQFTAAVRSQNSGYRETTEGQRKRRTLLSMSPSAMQSEAAMKGFHILQFQFADTGELSSVSVEHHQYHKKQYTSFERQFPMVPS